MIPTRQQLLQVLPVYRDQWTLVKKDQEVHDIISEILTAQNEFAASYDLIAPFFWAGNLKATCEKIYKFLERNISYSEEPEGIQTVSAPVGIVSRGFGDCKHYSLFVGGILGALTRRGLVIDWCFCFASYKLGETTPYHVFVVCETEDGPMWVDPTPGAPGMVPVWVVCKRSDGADCNYMVTEQTGKIGGCGRDAVGSTAGYTDEGVVILGLLVAGIAALIFL